MNLKSNYFHVMYRENAKEKLPKNARFLDEFKLIKNPAFHWCADPFPILIDGKRYIFAEIMSRITGKASIGYVCLDGKKKKWKKCFRPKFHISFPNIFVCGENVFAMPETYQDRCLAKYAVSKKDFSWKKDTTVLSLPYCVDSCFDIDGKTILLTYENDEHCSKKANHLVVRDFSNPSEVLFSIVDDRNVLRPAGNCFLMDGSLILPTQDCSAIYGGGIIFNEIDLENKRIEPLSFSIYPSDIKANSKYAKAVGCHTYNCCGDLEVIDILLPQFAFRGLLHKIKAFFRG